MTAPLDTDVVVIGSGFGGSVAALRAAEKGYRVVVLEQGRRVVAADFDAAERDVRRLVWAPPLRLGGYVATHVLRDVAVLAGVGWGGGSLVYGAVLLEPPPELFEQPGWRRTCVNWRKELAPHYATAARMLGRTTVPQLGAMDGFLAGAARTLGASASFGATPVGIHFGDGAAADPYFGGAGPARRGCTSCGRCLAGCPIGAKSSLDVTYLHLALGHGVAARTRHRATRIAPIAGGYQVDSVDPLTGEPQPSLTAARVVVAAGVLGTVELLLRCRDEHRTLPRLSARLGRGVHTNGEAIVGVEHSAAPADLTRGVAISSHFYPDARTHVTQNRLPSAHGLLRLVATPLPGAGRGAIATLRRWADREWWRRVTVLTAMQAWSGELRLGLERRWWQPWRTGLASRSDGSRPPARLPIAEDVARAVADAAGGGSPFELGFASVTGRAVTAHILGGCAVAANPADGVIDAGHEVFGHPGLFVVDGSAAPADIGVNPSLTITALAERCLSRWAPRSAS